MKAFNPILSRNFIYSDLKFTNDGLYYVNKINTNRDELLVSTSYKDILSLINIDMEVLNEMSEDEFFAMLVDNPYIKLDKFFKVKENNKVELFDNFATYLKENNVEPRGSFKRINIDDFLHLHQHFNILLSESNFWLRNRNFVNNIFNGATIKKNFPTYDMSILNETMPMFKNHFGSKREFELYILTTDEGFIHDSFLDITTKVI